MTGLVIGSMTPDFEYFIRMRKGVSNYSHSIAGILWFDLPLGLFLVFLFHAVVRKPLIQHLPRYLHSKLHPYEALQWRFYFEKRWMVLIVSLLIGTASHLIWDRVTHMNADYFYAKQHIVFSFSSWQNHSVIYLFVHVVHSGIGALFLLLALLRRPRLRTSPNHRPIFKYWLSVSILAFVILLIHYLLSANLTAADTFVSVISAFLIAMVAVSLLISKTALELN
jgi:hypothetical protein